MGCFKISSSGKVTHSAEKWLSILDIQCGWGWHKLHVSHNIGLHTFNKKANCRILNIQNSEANYELPSSNNLKYTEEATKTWNYCLIGLKNNQTDNTSANDHQQKDQGASKVTN